MKRLIAILLIAICYNDLSYAITKVSQSIMLKDGKAYLETDNRAYEIIPIISVKYDNLSKIQQKYNTIRYNKRYL